MPRSTFADLKATAGIGVPVPVRFGLEVPLLDQFDGAVELGYGPYPSISTFSINSGAVEARVHYYPGWGPLYFGTGLGYQLFRIGTTLDLGSLAPTEGPSNATFNFQFLYVALGFGCRWNLSEALTLGFDLGVQIPLANWGSLSLPSKDVVEQDLANASSNALGYLSNLILPRVNLIKIGYAF